MGCVLLKSWRRHYRKAQASALNDPLQTEPASQMPAERFSIIENTDLCSLLNL
jgi:hypothetical protein